MTLRVYVRRCFGGPRSDPATVSDPGEASTFAGDIAATSLIWPALEADLRAGHRPIGGLRLTSRPGRMEGLAPGQTNLVARLNSGSFRGGEKAASSAWARRSLRRCGTVALCPIGY